MPAASRAACRSRTSSCAAWNRLAKAGLRFRNPASCALITFDCGLVLADAVPKDREATLRHAGSRQLLAVIGLAIVLVARSSPLCAQSVPGARPESAKALSQGEWPAYAGSYA